MALEIIDIPSALKALRLFEANMPVSTPPRLRTLLTAAADEASPAKAIRDAAEALYAYRGNLTINGKRLLVGLVSIATLFDWSGLQRQDARGIRIVKAIRRELGEESPTGSWPAPAEDPPALAEFVEPPPPPVPEP